MASSTFKVGQLVEWATPRWRGHRARVVRVYPDTDRALVVLLSVPREFAACWRVGDEVVVYSSCVRAAVHELLDI